MKKSLNNLSNQKFGIPDYSPGNPIFPAEADRIHHFRLMSNEFSEPDKVISDGKIDPEESPCIFQYIQGKRAAILFYISNIFIHISFPFH